MKELENLRALVYCSGLTTYQKVLARREFEQLTNSQPSGKSAEEIFDDIFTPIDTDNIMRYKKDIINAMHEYSQQQPTPLADIIEFANWLNNNWYIPAEDGMWRIMVEHIEYQGKKPKVNVFSTEELYELFTSQKSNNK